MTNWSIFNGSDTEWDRNVIEFNANYRQLSSWANLKKLKKWKVLKLVFNSNKKTFIQIFYKKFYFISFFYCSGGPIGSVKSLDNLFIEFIKKITNTKICYIRVDDSSSDNENLIFFEKSNLWSRPKFRTNEGRSAYLELPNKFEEGDFLKNLSRDFKYSLNRSKKKNLISINTSDPNSHHLVKISMGMFDKKKIKMMELQDFEDMKIAIKRNILFFISYDKENTPLAYRAILKYDDKAWDIAAATSIAGRKKFAGFGLFYEIIKTLVNASVGKFYLGALVSHNPGVNSFKMGTGAKEQLYVGEFEYCSVAFLKNVINLLIKFTLSKKFIKFNFIRRLYH